MGDLQTFAVVDTFAHTLSKAEANTLDNTLGDAKAEGLIVKLVVTLIDAKHKTLGVR